MKRTKVVPLIAALGLLAVVVSINLHGLRHMTSPTPANIPISFDPWIHGWPFEYTIAGRHQALENGRNVILRVRFGSSHRWIVSQSTADLIPISVLGLNLLLGTTTVVAVFFLLRMLFEKLKWNMRFTIRSALVMTTIIAVGFAVRQDVTLFVEVYHLKRAFTWSVLYVCCMAVVLCPMIALGRLLYAKYIRDRSGF